MGTMNCVRPHVGPAFARIAAPIRVLLKPGAEFPSSDELQEVLNQLKLLFTCDAVLRVADDRAALEAANAWIAGDELRMVAILTTILPPYTQEDVDVELAAFASFERDASASSSHEPGSAYNKSREKVRQ